MKRLAFHHSDDYDLIKLQDNIREVFNAQQRDVPIMDGQLISDISILSGTPKTVNHNLNRTLRGFFVALKNANSDVWDSQNVNPRKDKTLILNSSANVTITIWVF